MIWEVARDQEATDSEPRAERSLLSLLGVDYLIGKASVEATTSPASGIHFEHFEQSFPRTWISHELVHFPLLKSASPEHVRARTKAIFFPAGKARDLRSTAVVEGAAKPVANETSTGNVPSSEDCQITDYQPQQVTIEAQLVRPGMVILSDTYSQDWRASVAVKKGNRYQASRTVPVYRTNRVMRGVYLPAGDYRITYRYHPSLFWIGSIVTLLTCLGCGVTLLLVRKKQDAGQ